MYKFHFFSHLFWGVALLTFNCLTAQPLIDFSVGTSHQDNAFSSLAVRYQVSDVFRAGIELQYGQVKYRFIEAKPIREGYAFSVSVPMSFRLYQRDNIRLDAFLRSGMRFQGIIDPDENDKRDSVLNSTGFFIDPGLIVTIPINDRLALQSGVTLPFFFETAPTTLMENAYTNILAGISYQMKENQALYFKSTFGTAFGASGDTQKFGWSVQAGIRFSLGKASAQQLLFTEPSF